MNYINKFPMKVGVVLSGGGAKGAYEAGALRAIVDKTKAIHVITGASIGAINAAVFAWEYEQTGDMVKAAEKVKSTWLELDGLFKISPLKIVWNALEAWLKTGSPVHLPSLVDNSKIKAKINQLIPPRLKISQLKRIELAINATCLTTGKTITFTRANDTYLGKAVSASSCLPLVFKTQKIRNQYYIDGGIFNNTPLRDALMARVTHAFVVELKPKLTDLYFQIIKDTMDFNSAYRVGTRLIELITDKIMYEDLKNARKINSIIEVIMALEATDGNRKIIEKLKTSIGYAKNGRIKRKVEFFEIAPSQRLEPPGTLGFEDIEAIKRIMKLGEADAREQLEEVVL